jgi:hypothetical protein
VPIGSHIVDSIPGEERLQMMKIVATFNVPYYEYEVDSYQAREVTSQLEKAGGVHSVQFLKAIEGSPRFALEIACADELVESVSAHANQIMGQYASYISDLAVRTFRQLA